MKFYTEEGNWDLVGNNTPIFFIRDPIFVSLSSLSVCPTLTTYTLTSAFCLCPRLTIYTVTSVVCVAILVWYSNISVVCVTIPVWYDNTSVV